MLTTTTRLKLQEILGRVARSEPVSLQERVLLQKYADRDRTVSSWVHRAERLRQRGCAAPGLDGLLLRLPSAWHLWPSFMSLPQRHLAIFRRTRRLHETLCPAPRWRRCYKC